MRSRCLNTLGFVARPRKQGISWCVGGLSHHTHINDLSTCMPAFLFNREVFLSKDEEIHILCTRFGRTVAYELIVRTSWLVCTSNLQGYVPRLPYNCWEKRFMENHWLWITLGSSPLDTTGSYGWPEPYTSSYGNFLCKYLSNWALASGT